MFDKSRVSAKPQKGEVDIQGYSGYWIGPRGMVSTNSTIKHRPKKLFERRRGSGCLYVSLTDDNGKTRNCRYGTLCIDNLGPLMTIERHPRKILDESIPEAVKLLKKEQLTSPIVLEKYSELEIRSIHPQWVREMDMARLGELF
tara:strand:+ start:1233 stop:1664 length:432 start_codon:yes stop_codon:yes gene_type:complete